MRDSKIYHSVLQICKRFTDFGVTLAIEVLTNYIYVKHDHNLTIVHPDHR